jgi:hypothetical protein
MIFREPREFSGKIGFSGSRTHDRMPSMKQFRFSLTMMFVCTAFIALAMVICMSIPNYWKESERSYPMKNAPDDMKLVTYQVSNPPAEVVWRRFAMACPLAVLLGVGTVVMIQRLRHNRGKTSC